jgi:hypothetical protein
MELEVFFTIIQQTYSKLVLSFMNRKSSCGYATHFFYLLINCSALYGTEFIILLIYSMLVHDVSGGWEKLYKLLIAFFAKNPEFFI